MSRKPRPKVVNRSGYVLGDNGQRVYGMDAEHMLKMRSKQDPEWVKKVAQWVVEITGVSFDVEEGMFDALRSGEVLCELINKLQPGLIPRFNRFDSDKEHNALGSNENIKLYLAACKELNVPPGDIFLPDDLRTGRNMMAVCQNIASLSRTARAEHGWEGSIVGPQLSTKGPKTWQDVEVNASMFIDDYCETDAEAVIMEYKELLDEEKEKVVRAMSGRALLEQEVERLGMKIKEQELMIEEAARTGAARRSAQAAAGIPASIERSSTPELRRKRMMNSKSAHNLRHEREKSASNINEWQSKVSDIKNKNLVKRERRMSFGSQLDQNTEDGEISSEPLIGGKRRTGSISRIWVSRRTLKVIIAVQFTLLLGATAAAVYFGVASSP